MATLQVTIVSIGSSLVTTLNAVADKIKAALTTTSSVVKNVPSVISNA